MTRGTLSSNVMSELTKQSIQFTVLAWFDFSDQDVYLWAGPRGHSLDWDGQTWDGVGDLGKIDKITEASEMRDARTSASLRMSSDMLSRIDTNGEANRGRSAQIRFLFLNEDGTSINEWKIPYEIGGMNVSPNLSEGEDGARIVEEVVSVELLGRQALLGRTLVRRQTHQDTLEINSDDYGNEFASDPDQGKTLGAGVQDARIDRINRETDPVRQVGMAQRYFPNKFRNFMRGRQQ